jgi:hypothetical protein
MRPLNSSKLKGPTHPINNLVPPTITRAEKINLPNVQVSQFRRYRITRAIGERKCIRVGVVFHVRRKVISEPVGLLRV